MSDGYTPVFQSVFTGTLHGKWPDTGLWLCLLAMANKRGELDCTPHYIASVTGLSLEDVTACLERFVAPDEYSRSPAEGGRRLVLLDPSRPWGWRIVNFAAYRERARLRAKAEREVLSGDNASRMGDRRRPPETAGDRRSTPVTAPDRPSNANKDSDTDGRSGSSPPSKTREGRRARERTRTVPEDFMLSSELRSWSLAEVPDLDIEREFAKFRDHEFREPHSDWNRTWRRWVRTAKDGQRYAKSGGERRWE